jgi:hypothetical protein
MSGVKRLLLASTTLLVGGLILYALGVAIIGTVQAFNRPSADAQNVVASNKLLAVGHTSPFRQTKTPALRGF